MPICLDWGIWLISESHQKCVSIIIGLLFVNEFGKAIALLPGWRSLLHYHYLSVIKKL
ncbi:MAG: hypothetical protein HWQ58_15770 [Nostoc sp. LPT]|uniref:hypothetical protein n=1 Tax=uncultured Nostoc sp. TaxID=340711 RepID=UPI001D81F6CC|nr:hypothetical protein [Nostoc sp. LPT]